MRKAKVTNELANGFPEWTKIRTDDQSIGKSFLNVIGLQMEPIFTELFRAYKNFYLDTAFTGEIDQTYKLSLPANFEFTVDSTNSLSPLTETPTISGLIDSTWYSVQEVVDGNISSFWYNALPNRLSEIEQVSIDGFLVASGLSSDVSLTLVTSGLELDNRLSIVVDGDKLVEVDSDNNLQRSKVRIEGTTWKDTEESEDVIFLFSETRPTFKAWTSIDRIQPVDFVSESSISVYSHQFNQPYYLDAFDTLGQFSESRENLPLFWSIDTSIAGESILVAQRYSANRAIELLKVKPSIVEFQNWELLNQAGNTITVNDITVVPNQQRIYAITNDRLYIYDTFFELPDLQELSLRTPNALIDIETSSDYVIRDEELEVSAVFKRPIKTIVKHRIKLKYPDGAEFGLLEDGTLVPVTSDFWIAEETSDRFIRQPFIIELSEFGQHTITLECQYLDGTVETAQRAVLVQSKSPLAELDLSSITTTAVGIDIDHKNQLLILDDSNIVHNIKLHYDIALIDYTAKEIIFREPYEEVKVIK